MSDGSAGSGATVLPAEPRVNPITSPILRVEGVAKSFGPIQVLKAIEMTIEIGEVVFIIGPSGSGKSTFLRCLNFLEKPNAGTIEFGGTTLCSGSKEEFRCAPERIIREVRTQMPMVFQHFNLFKHMTVLQNVVEGPCVVQKRDRREVVDEATDILRELGLADKADFYPAQISGGQQQRVGIARALAMRPKLILFDEPTSSLDPELVSGILESIRTLAEAGMTMIVVTHEMAFARNLASRIHFMAEGSILESGTPASIFEAPRSERLRSFLQTMLR
ncbi:MAG: amino acid ABC transporter ATP-binding protein [Acetobacteraceae bacterium]